MISEKDPLVGQVLDLFVPELDVDPDELLPAAHAGAARLRAARRRRTAAVLAFAVLLLFAGAAFAAKKLDLLPFLHTSDRNTARFSVSPSHSYHGTAPLALTCPHAAAGAFVCHLTSPLASGKRRYELGMRTDKVPLLTRPSMLTSLTRAQANGADPAQVAHVRADLAGVSDDFIRALSVMTRIDTVGGGGGSAGPSGTERVPPPGVPVWVACRELTLATVQCRPLAALLGVPGGTPLYSLQPSSDWRTVTTPPQQPPQFERLLERLLGRQPTATESRFLVDLATVAVTAGGSSGPSKVKGTPIGVSNPRGAALLAPQSLGVPTRVRSATAQPLPNRPLPGGLSRSRGTRLYRVAFDLPRADGVDTVGRHTLYVYVTRSSKLAVWRVAWVATKP